MQIVEMDRCLYAVRGAAEIDDARLPPLAQQRQQTSGQGEVAEIVPACPMEADDLSKDHRGKDCLTFFTEAAGHARNQLEACGFCQVWPPIRTIARWWATSSSSPAKVARRLNMPDHG
ncbi:hypothetical protein [Mesorhizobium shangrilense]|uniref:hypothetical protein n=1 Tax=Mesorhizobium shangrilense TaxID=460060 RepID=UPI003F495082